MDTTAAATPELSPGGTRSQHWLARLSFVLAGLAIVLLLVFAGLKSLAMLAVGVAAAVVSLAAAYVFLSRRGMLRWLSLAVFVAGADRGHRRLRIQGPAVDRAPVGGGLAAREPDRTRGTDR